MNISPSLKQIIVYGVGLIGTKLVSFVMLPLVTHFLSPAEFGTLEILQLWIYLFSMIFGFGISDAIFRFAGFSNSPSTIDDICGNGRSLNLIICCSIFIILILFAQVFADLLPGNITVWQIYFLSGALMFNSLWGYQLSVFRLKQEAIHYTFINIIFSVLLAIFTLIMLYHGYSVTGMMLATFVANMLVFLGILVFKMDTKFHFDMEWQKKLFFYGLPLLLSGFGEFIILWLGNFWLAYSLKLADFAQFALAMKFSILIGFVMTPILTWWYPIRFKNLETIEGRIRCARITESAVILGFLVAFSLAVMSSVFIKLFISADYHQAINYLPWACLIYGFKNAGDLMNIGVYANNTRLVMWINNFAAILTILGFYVLIPSYKIWGGIIVLNCIYLFRWIAFTIFSQQLLHLPYRFFSLMLCCILFIGGLFAIHFMSSNFDYLIKGGVLCIILLLITYSRGFIPRMLFSH